MKIPPACFNASLMSLLFAALNQAARTHSPVGRFPVSIKRSPFITAGTLRFSWLLALLCGASLGIAAGSLLLWLIPSLRPIPQTAASIQPLAIAPIQIKTSPAIEPDHAETQTQLPPISLEEAGIGLTLEPGLNNTAVPSRHKAALSLSIEQDAAVSEGQDLVQKANRAIIADRRGDYASALALYEEILATSQENPNVPWKSIRARAEYLAEIAAP